MTITLLHSVGDVLKKVDTEGNPDLDEIVDRAFDSWKKDHKIFSEFIEEERNNVLKEYKFGTSIGVIVDVPCQEIGKKEQETGSVEYTHHYKGWDPQDVVEEAIRWWEDRLGEIDSLAQNPPSSTS